MDRLTMESTAASEAGMSYGRWKAMQSLVPVVKEEPKKEGTWYTCACCGNRFFQTDKFKRKYCGDECRIKMDRKRQYDRYHRTSQVENPQFLPAECQEDVQMSETACVGE